MRSEQKTILGETGRWLRITTFTLTTLAPLLRTFALHLPKRPALILDEDDVQAVRSDLDAQIEAELEKRRAQQLEQEVQHHKVQQAAATSQEKLQNLVATSQEKLQTAGTAITGSISDVKSHPYTKKLRKQSGNVADTLKERASDLTHSIADSSDKLGQTIADQSNKLGQTITDRGDDLSHELRKRGKNVKRTVLKQNRKLQKRWRKQFQQPQQEGKKSFWIALGFGFGLTLAGFITYQFIRRRLQRQHEEEADLQLSYTDGNTTASHNGIVTNVATKDNVLYPTASTVSTASTAAPTISEQDKLTATTAMPPMLHQSADIAPPNAAFMGVTSSKLYYPIETPLDHLPISNDSPVDVVYFSSEKEAMNLGFKPAASDAPRASSADRTF